MNPVYRAGHTFFRLTARILFDYRVIHPEKLIQRGPVLLVCNHVSFIDPPMVGIAFRTELHYLARKTLFESKVTSWLYPRWNAIPVDQTRPDMSSLKKMLRLMQEGHRVLVFPEGARSEDGEVGEAQPGVGLLIAKSRAPILPIRLYGAYDALPRGAKRLRSTPVRLVVGDVLDLDEDRARARSKEDYRKLADRTVEAIRDLPPPPGWPQRVH
jgi:1-acyl-sn-glycerol-3-phosphate acyltransferase